MTPLGLALAGAGILAASAALSLVLARAGRIASAVAVAGALAGCGAGLWAALEVLRSGLVLETTASWQVPGGALVVGVDPLTAFFLVPLFVLGALAAVYGRQYLGGHARPAFQAGSAATLNLLVAAMAGVLLARHALLFLVAWEAMTLLAYWLVTLDHQEAEVRRAGWAYLVASHVGVMALLALFLTLGRHAGGALDFDSLQVGGVSSRTAAAGLFALALVGFGIKAGVVGLHVWLPEAHGAAPSHVSALMSGALIKLGVYGLLRVVSMLPPSSAYGAVLMGLGLAGALLGITLAIDQRDLKRALAYSSIENVGIVLLGLGLGLWAAARRDALLATLAFSGGLLHLWNHAAMKGSMFLAAGSVLHGAGSKDLEQLGGLARRMPVTGATMLFGSVAIAALPPLNGFVGEWLIYRGLATVGLRSEPGHSLAALAGIAVLALVGGLAALCFVRIAGIALLGQPRGEGARLAHESPLAMTIPPLLLAALCLAAALLPGALLSTMAPLVAGLAGADIALVAATASSLAPLVTCNAVLLGVLAIVGLLLSQRVRGAARDDTWGCGYAAPGPRMQYTARSFSEILVDRLLPRMLRSRAEARPPAGLFPAVASWSSQSTDPLTRGVYEPFFTRWADRFARLRWLQQGSLHLYLVYVVATVVIGLLWAGIRGWWL